MKLAIASCVRLQDVNPQPVWADVQAARPDALLLLGDNVYLERNDHSDPAALAAELRALYAAQFAEPHFAALLQDMRARGAPVLALYDDHDFLGDNRCGADAPPPLRDAARAEFIRAFDPARTGDEVYALHRLGALDLAVLDTRLHRRAVALSATDPDAMLGAAQWAWLDAALRTSTAPYFAVASGTTLHAFGDESWEFYPAAFARLVGLLKRHPHALVLAGDVHRNAVYDDSGVIEVVSSAAARRGMVFGALRRNWGLLEFGAGSLHVQLHSLKVSGRFDFCIPRANWVLP